MTRWTTTGQTQFNNITNTTNSANICGIIDITIRNIIEYHE